MKVRWHCERCQQRGEVERSLANVKLMEDLEGAVLVLLRDDTAAAHKVASPDCRDANQLVVVASWTADLGSKYAELVADVLVNV